jgi:RimJ/RimL family protein N-acetyltransferase
MEVRLLVRRAGVDDIEEVLGVLDEVAAWLAERRIRQWPAQFEVGWVRPALEAGQTWLADVDGRVAATITLAWCDPVWGPDDGAAGYVHRLAVRRHATGLGVVLLQWAQDQALLQGRHLLRLDCVTSNRDLRRIYEDAGFTHRGDVEVAGPPGERDDAARHRTLVSRYERP